MHAALTIDSASHPSADHPSHPLAGRPCRPHRKPDFHYTPPDHSTAITNRHIGAFITTCKTERPKPFNLPAGLPASLTKKYDRSSFKSPSLMTVVAITLIVLSPFLSPTPAMSATPVSATPATPTPASWRWPLNGPPRILRRFAPPPAPWLIGHRGIDLAAPAATPVLAAGQGTIGYAGSVGGRGVVTVDHPGGLRTTYLPVTAAVRPGDPVSPGDHLGTVEPGSSHCPESCLHWGLRRAAAYLDPLLLLGHARIRLLPYWHATITPTPPTATSTPTPHSPSNDHTRGRGELAGDTGALVDVERLDDKRLDERERPSGQPLPLAPARPDRHHTPTTIATPGHFSLRSAATPLVSALGIAVLLTVLILLTLLRHRMRPNKCRRNPAGGRHSTRSDHTPTTDIRCHTTGQHRKPRRSRTRRQ